VPQSQNSNKKVKNSHTPRHTGAYLKLSLYPFPLSEKRRG
jgi:hypothetical protein